MRDRLDEARAGEGMDRIEPWLAVQQFLAKTPACVMVVQMEDVFGVVPQANLPGTVDQHPNWRRKLPVPIEQWARDARIRSLARVLAAGRGRARSKAEAPARFDEAPLPRATYRVELNAGFTFRDA